MTRAVACPHCGKSVPWGPESPFRPFCSERCRLIDLGDWFEERHRVPGPPDAGGDWPGDDSPPERDDERYAAH